MSLVGAKSGILTLLFGFVNWVEHLEHVVSIPILRRVVAASLVAAGTNAHLLAHNNKPQRPQTPGVPFAIFACGISKSLK